MTTTQASTVLRRLRRLVAPPADPTADADLLARFVAARDEAAFAELVRRHGPMVLRVCRGVLRDGHDADDVFQATFLVLARKAAAIRKGDSVASWLYGVATRAAVQARADASRRRRHEQRASAMPPSDPTLDLTVRELHAILHEELHRLPEKYRAPLVLCYLEGLTQEEAGRRLGWSKGATRGRLDRGRERLRMRLAQRGVELTAVLGMASVGGAASAAPALMVSAVRGALSSLSDGAASGAVPAKAAAIAEGVIRAMFAERIRNVSAVVLAVLVFAAGAGTLTRRALAESPQDASAKENAWPADVGEKEKGDVYAGRVLGPDGKPVAGAKLYLTRVGKERPAPPAVQATSDKDGRFRFRVTPANAEDTRFGPVVAVAEGFGLAWAPPLARNDDLTLNLVKDVPVEGRVVDLEGRPTPGVIVRATAVRAPTAGTLTPWLDAVKARKEAYTVDAEYLDRLSTRDATHLFPARTTGADGRFCIAGVGGERVVTLTLEGPTIEAKDVNVLTRPDVPPRTVPSVAEAPSLGSTTYYAARFDHAAAPCRTVVGVVRDKATGRPLAGAVIRAERPYGNPIRYAQATTDKEGRYRLTGLPRVPAGERDAFVVLPPPGEPYLAVRKPAGAESEGEIIPLDVALPRGVWLEGRVTDKATGKGVESRLGYHLFPEAGGEAELGELFFPRMAGDGLRTDRAGRFRFVGYPGRGLLGARVDGANGANNTPYRVGAGAEAIAGHEGRRGAGQFNTVPTIAGVSDYDVLAEVNPPKGAARVTCDLALDPGRAVTVRVQGPDGKPLAGALAHGQFAREFWGHAPVAAEFTAFSLTPGEGRTLLFWHEGKKLVGRLDVKADETGPVTVTLAPAASVAGRVIDDDGRPVRQATLSVSLRRNDTETWLYSHHQHRVRTDEEGRFRLDGLLPGTKYQAGVRTVGRRYSASVFADLVLKSGEVKDLGDVKPRRGDDGE